jgi:hypothetical protein
MKKLTFLIAITFLNVGALNNIDIAAEDIAINARNNNVTQEMVEELVYAMEAQNFDAFKNKKPGELKKLESELIDKVAKASGQNDIKIPFSNNHDFKTRLNFLLLVYNAFDDE